MYKFIVLLLLSFNLCAESVMIEKSIYTKHLQSYYPYNNDNNMTAIEYKKGDWYFNASKFDNSFYRKSITLGAGYNLYSAYRFDLDILFGGATGYDEKVPGIRIRMPCIKSICFYLSPRLTYSIPLTNGFYLVPSVKIFGSAAEIAAGLKYEF